MVYLHPTLIKVCEEKGMPHQFVSSILIGLANPDLDLMDFYLDSLFAHDTLSECLRILEDNNFVVHSVTEAYNYKVIRDGFVYDKLTELDVEIEERIQEYRELFSNKKIGGGGDKKSCIKKLRKWFRENKEYSFDDVMQTAQYYTDNTDSRFIQRADYFVYKYQESRLSSLIEDIIHKDHTDPTINLI